MQRPRDLIHSTQFRNIGSAVAAEPFSTAAGAVLNFGLGQYSSEPVRVYRSAKSLPPVPRNSTPADVFTPGAVRHSATKVSVTFSG